MHKKVVIISLSFLFLLFLLLFTSAQIESLSGPPVFNQSTESYDLIYDANGNLIQGFGKYLEYDSWNRLSRIKYNNSNGSVISEYFYDHEGNRIKKIAYNVSGTIHNESTYYMNTRPADFIQVVNTNGTEINETYIYLQDKLIAKIDTNNRKFFYHPDHLGSTSLVTNESGAVVEDLLYLPYGDVLSGGEVNRYLYTGQENDKESGFLDYGARQYDSRFKRFIQPDPIIADIYDPQNLNRYAYVLNNPYKYTDPNGESPLLVAGIGVVGYSLIQGTISAGLAYKAGGSYSDAGKYFAAGTAEGFAKSATFVGGVYLAATTTGGAALSGAGLLGYAASAAGTGAKESVLNKLYGTSNQVTINDLMESAIDPTFLTLDNEFRFDQNSDPYADPDRRLSENEYLAYQQNQLTYQSYANQNDGGKRNPNLFQTPSGATPGGSGSSGGGSSSSGGSSGGGSGCGFTMSCGGGCGSFMSCI